MTTTQDTHLAVIYPHMNEPMFNNDNTSVSNTTLNTMLDTTMLDTIEETIYTENSNMYTEDNNMYTEDSNIYTEDSNMYTEDNMYTGSNTMYSEDTIQLEQPNFLLEEINMDDPYSLASKTFYITCHKISRQNNPSYRKKPPYTFLQNWLVHNIFSKSQQILLRFPVIHPRVMMTEGDFIYTPHQLVDSPEFNSGELSNDQYYMNNEDQLQYNFNEEEEDEEEVYDYYDESFFMGEEGVMMMSASAPDASHFMSEEDDDINIHMNNTIHASSLVMDENTWMGHSRYNNNNLTLHVVNPDNNPEEDRNQTGYRNAFNANNPYLSIVNTSYKRHLQVVEEEEEEEEVEEDVEEEEEEDLSMMNTTDQYEDRHTNEHPLSYGLSMSPEVIHWYRSAEVRISTSNDPQITSPLLSQPVCDSLLSKSYDDNNHPHNNNNNTSSSHCMSSSSSSSNGSSIHSQRTDMKAVDEVEKTTRRSMDSYQSLADIIMTDDNDNHQSTTTSYGTLTYQHEQDTQPISVLMEVSTSLVDAACMAMDLAQNYTDHKNHNSMIGFVGCVFKIWKTLFLGAESMLAWNTS